MIYYIKENDLSTKDSEKEDNHNRNKGKVQDENEKVFVILWQVTFY